MSPPPALDDLDRRIVVLLQQDGRASWTAIADAAGSSVATVARRGQQLLARGAVRVAVVPALGSSGPESTFLVRITCSPGTAMPTAAELVAMDDVRFLSLVTGDSDIIAEVAVRGGAAEYPHLVARLSTVPGVERWRSGLVMHTYKVSHDWSRQLAPAGLSGAPALPVDDAAHTCGPDHFDDADRALVVSMRPDGRVTFAAVADRLGLNESNVRRRFDRLRSTGCVRTLTLVAAPALGMGAEVLLSVTVDPAQLESVAEALGQRSEVRYLASVLDDNSLLCEVITSSVDGLHAFVTGVLAHLPGVRGWAASMELVSLKRGFIETPWWRGQLSGTPLEGPVGGAGARALPLVR